MEKAYNLKSPAVKRLMREAQELSKPTSEYSAKPLDDNLFEWHFTFRGPEESEFDGGIYHGRIILPPEYPMKPPSIMLLNPNGRFELNKKICLSISGYHPESWQPSWSIRTAILAIIGFMPSKGEGAIGALDYSADERKTLAKRSTSFKCAACGNIRNLINSREEIDSKNISEAEKKDQELAKQIMFAKPKTKQPSTSEPSPETSNAVENETNSVLRNRNPETQNEAPVEDISADLNTDQTQTTETATSQQNRRPEPDSNSFMLLVVLTVALALLFFRRLNRMYNLSDLL